MYTIMERPQPAFMPDYVTAPVVSIRVQREYSIATIVQIVMPSDAANTLHGLIGNADQEHMVTLVLDTKNRILAAHEVYRGSLNASIVRVGEVFKAAIALGGAAIIVAHNHPSGDPTPSPEDVLVTRRIVEAGKLLDIECLDHVIIGERPQFVSLRERGLGF